MTESDPRLSPQPAAKSMNRRAPRSQLIITCDRCGDRMYEKNCKVICPNCGSRFDCSDLSIRID